MQKSTVALTLLLVTIVVLGVAATVWWKSGSASVPVAMLRGEAGDSFTETEGGFDSEPAVPADYRIGAGSRYSFNELANWQRPPGPTRVGLQVGHWQNDQVPSELSNLTRNGGGAAWGGLSERDVVYEIVQLTAARLREAGVVVDILPATVPPGYSADAFISVHADGNPSGAVNGFKIAGPRRDYAGTSDALVAALYERYGPATGLREDPTITRRMTAYYAFNWPRYEHAVHPFTPAAIVETGFLTSAIDRAIIVDAPDRAAAGIAEGVMAFLESTPQRKQLPTAMTPPVLPIKSVVSCAPLRAERRERATEYDCLPAVADSSGAWYVLGEYSSTSAPLGSLVRVRGDFIPVQTIDTYFWFPYEVAGILQTVTLTTLPAADG